MLRVVEQQTMVVEEVAVVVQLMTGVVAMKKGVLEHSKLAEESWNGLRSMELVQAQAQAQQPKKKKEEEAEVEVVLMPVDCYHLQQQQQEQKDYYLVSAIQMQAVCLLQRRSIPAHTCHTRAPPPPHSRTCRSDTPSEDQVPHRRLLHLHQPRLRLHQTLLLPPPPLPPIASQPRSSR